MHSYAIPKHQKILEAMPLNPFAIARYISHNLANYIQIQV